LLVDRLRRENDSIDLKVEQMLWVLEKLGNPEMWSLDCTRMNVGE